MIRFMIYIGLLTATACSRAPDLKTALPSHQDSIPEENGPGFPVTYFSDVAKVKAGEPSLRIMNALVELVDGALPGSDIFMNIYEIDYIPLVRALEAAQKRGVLLHLMIDSSKAASWKKNKVAVTALKAVIRAPGELVLIDNDNGVNAINHHKHLLFSRVKLRGNLIRNAVFTTSENFTNRELTVLEDAILFSDPDMYNAFIENWHKMKQLALSGMKRFAFGSFYSNSGAVQAQFFPERMAGSWDGHYQVADFLDSLDGHFDKDTIRVGMDQWSDGQLEILEKLMSLHDKGAQIEIIVRNEHSIGLGSGFLGKLHAFKDRGAEVLILPDDQIIHSKFMMVQGQISGKQRKVLLVGTLNYTNPATQHNNNLLLKIEDPEVFAKYRANFKNIQEAYKN